MVESTALVALPPMSLGEILARMQALDDGLVALDLDECRVLAERAEIKVDAYRGVLDQIEARSEAIGRAIKELQAAKKSLDTKANGLLQLLTFHMQSKGFEKLPGQAYEVTLRKSESVEIDEAFDRPDSSLYRTYSDFIRRTYEWDKKALNDGIKSGVFKHPNIRIKASYKAQFKVRKDI